MPEPSLMSASRPTAVLLGGDRDDDPVARVVQRAGFQCHYPEDIDAARALLDAKTPDLLLVDVGGHHYERLEILEHEVARHAREIVATSDVDEPALARRCIVAGASYFFCKPGDPDFLCDLFTDVADESMRERHRDPSCRGGRSIDQFGLLRGSSRPMRRIYRTLRKVACTEASVLLIGESGTGKDLAAQTLHQLSRRSREPFVAVNCGAIPSELIESELFGHVKGSFSGAIRDHAGYFERARGGTLFLDEITEMPPDLQVKLLRVLESSRLRRVGSEQDVEADVRIVAATNRDPDEAVADGTLREDLYYRLAHFPLRIPPLRERGEDVHGLADHFLTELNQRNGTHCTFADDAVEVIGAHAWPGNVRELRSAVERGYIMADGVIRARHLPRPEDSATVDGETVRIPVGTSLDDAERRIIEATLTAHDGNRRETAEILGVSLKTLYNRLKRYAEDDDAPRARDAG